MGDPSNSEVYSIAVTRGELKPGRSSSGQFVTNDQTAEHFALGVVDFLRLITQDVYRSHPEALKDAGERLDLLESLAELIEAGKRPKAVTPEEILAQFNEEDR